MIITIKDPSGRYEKANIPGGGKPLGEMFAAAKHTIRSVQINGRFRRDWEGWVGSDANTDRVNVFVTTLNPWIGVILAIISLVVSVVMTPKPPKPNFNNRKEESSSIAGLHNAVESGSPRFYSFGQNRIYGTVISTGIDVAPDGRSMKGRVLYYMGRTDGEGIENIEDVIINDQPISNHPNIGQHIRLGTEDQAIIPGFENISQVFADNRTFSTSASIIYTTRGDNLNQVKPVIAFSSLAGFNSKGKIQPQSCQVRIERKLTADPVENFAEVSGSPFTFSGMSRAPMYFPVEITVAGVGAGDAWDLRFTKLTGDDGGGNVPPDPQLFNVEEIEWTQRNYPNDALLGLTDIPSTDFPSLESLKVSALVKGNRIPVPDGAGGFTRAWTRERVWIFRYLVTSKELGLGARWEESEFDDDWAAIEQAHYNEMVDGHDGDEARDLCDVIINNRQDGWEWLKKIAGEGRAVFIPSGVQWRYVIDRPRDPTMLISEPGNLIENSVVSEPLQPDPAINRVIVEYRDGDNNDLPDVIQLVDPDFTPGDPIVSDAVKLDTIKRESQAAREGMYYRKKQALVRRHWQAQGSTEFLYAEPMDTAWLYYPTASHLRGSSGFARGGGANAIVLDQLIELEAGEDYQVVIHHLSDNSVETRSVSSAAGMRGRLTVTPDFTLAPADGDPFSVDKVSTDQRRVRIQDLTLGEKESITILLSDYIPEVYTADPLPARTIRRFFDLTRTPPLPLRSVLVTEEISINRDGSSRSTLLFDVTPSFNHITGQLQGAVVIIGETTERLILAVTEPALADFYRNWEIEITEGPGEGEKKTVIDYNAERGAAVAGTWVEAPTSASLYKLSKRRYGELTGFRVEISGNGVDFAELATFAGTHGEYSERVEGGLQYFRFTPISHGVENLLARWTMAIATTGDLSAPQAPVQVVMAGHLKQVSVDIFQQRPTAEDLAGFEVEFWLVDGPTWHDNPANFLRTVKVPVQSDKAVSGNMLRRHTENFSELAYGSRVTAVARAHDRSNNFSASILAINNYLLQQVDTGDVAEGALTEFASFFNDAAIGQSGVDNNPLELASVALASVGRPILLLVQCYVTNPDNAIAATMVLELRRGAAYAGSLLIDSVSMSLEPEEERLFTFMVVNWPAPATHTFKVWLMGAVLSVAWEGRLRRLTALEIKDQAQAA